VCKHWTDVFYSPYVWNNFIVDDRTLTRTKYNYYSGWQHTIDHARTHTCLSRVGRNLFRPLHSFNNIFQFMTILSWCIDRSMETENKDIKTSLSYDFPCTMSQYDDRENLKLFGTGGEMLRTLKILLSKLAKLKTLKLTDLVLERFEANRLLDEIAENCHFTLNHLNIVNVTVVHCPILHIGCFFNLQNIAPNIDDDVITLIADSKITQLHLVQNKHTPTAISLSPCSAKAWRIVKRDNPNLKVHLRVESANCGEFVFQPEAPIYSILYRAPK
uniref:F-box domain-containing protein n=1 Tax=Megaselia scalaris TaxID=36166 RepID=T1H6H8_MEGSC